MSSLSYFSMFTGVGGFELAIQRAFDNTEIRGQGNEQLQHEHNSVHDTSQSNERQRTTCVGFAEIDKYASAVLAYQFPGVKNYGDATTINTDELPDFDLLVGGFPCQSFSVAGQRRGFEDTRGTLFFEIARIVKQKQPRLLVLENVKGLLSHDQGQTFHTILSTLDELGYDVEWQVLNSKDHGVPQNRERVFIIGYLRGRSGRKVFPFVGEDAGDSRQVGRDVSTCLDSNYYKGTSPRDIHKQRRQHVAAVLTPVRAEKRQNGRRMKESEEPMFTLTKQDLHGLYDGVRIRRLTPVECERLQGFPDDWTKYGVIDGELKEMSDTQRYKMMGNAVTVNVVADIMRRLYK